MESPFANHPAPAAPWHALFAPLPPGAVPVRKPVATPGTPGAADGSPIAGWEMLTLEMSAGPAGSRLVTITLDETGRAISASDWVMHRSERKAAAGEGEGLVDYVHLTVGGRIEKDGTFHGTRWRTVSVQGARGETLSSDSTPSQPTPEDARALLSIVNETVRRVPAR